MQKAFSFDTTTIKKIARGALIAMSGAAAIALLDYIGGLQIEDAHVAAVVAWVVPTAVNAIREYIKGV
jgi:hypothetical protein